MIFVKIVLVTIEIICGLLLVGVILLQKSKDEGLGLAFGAGMGETLFGSQATTVLHKITIGLGIVFLVNTLALDLLYTKTRSTSLLDSVPSAGVPSRARQPAAPVEPGAAGPSAGEQAAPAVAPLAPATETPAPAAAPAAEAPAAPANPAGTGGTAGQP